MSYLVRCPVLLEEKEEIFVSLLFLPFQTDERIQMSPDKSSDKGGHSTMKGALAQVIQGARGLGVTSPKCLALDFDTISNTE